jgi:hypothetical protein
LLINWRLGVFATAAANVAGSSSHAVASEHHNGVFWLAAHAPNSGISARTPPWFVAVL